MSAPTATPLPSPSPEYLAEDIGPTIVATASLMIAFSTIFVVLRYYARYLAQTKFGIEDAVIPIAWLAELGLCIDGILMVKRAGTGRHMEYILMTDPGKTSNHLKGVIVSEILHLPAVAFSKLCVVLLYLRIFTNKYARMVTWALVYIIIAIWIAYTIASVLQCRPFAFNWNKSIPGGKCFDLAALSQSSSVPNIVTDIVVLLLPIRTVLGLRISMGRRIGILLIFLTGSVGIVASIVRTWVFATIDGSFDVTFTHTQLVNWTIIEPGMYLLAACALSYKPLFRMLAKALHLDSFITYSQSFVWNTTWNGKSSKNQKDVHLGSMRSAGSGGFTKLHSGYDPTDEEAVTGLKENGELKIMVTKTWGMDVEARSISEDYDVADQEEFNRAVGRAQHPINTELRN